MSASLGKPRFDRLVGWSTGLAGWVAAACLTLALLATIQHVLGTEVYDDEAETALLGRSVLQSGLPRLTQEGQYFSNQRGADFGPRGEDSHHGWLPAYTAAVGWQLTAAPSANLPFVRAPFIVWALITVGALLYLARASGLPWSLAVAVTASVSLTGRWFAPLFATRYFGCAALGLTLMLLAFRHERWRPRALNYLLGALLLFHAQWAHGLPVIVATAPLLWWGGKPRASVPSAIWSATLLAAGTVTLLAYTKPLGKIVLTEDRLTLLGQLANDAAHVGQEPHVQHVVRLVQH